MKQLEKILSVTIEELNNIDTKHVNKYEQWLPLDSPYNTACYHEPASRSHYRLLIYISNLFFNQILFDIGTNACRSAIALSFNTQNNVKSYDVVQICPVNPVISNVEFILGDSTKDTDLLTAPFIFLDVDHTGEYEDIFYQHLKNIQWKGILMLDDIHLNTEMKNFWNSITESKYDLTYKGHWSGTGIVKFE